MNPLNQETLAGKLVLGVVRHMLTSVAGGFVVKGYITNDQQTQLVSALVVVIGIGLSAYDKIQQHQPKQGGQ